MFRFTICVVAVAMLAIFGKTSGWAQSSVPKAGTPETAFVSGNRYTNAFFGFSLEMPYVRVHLAPSKSPDPSIHTLFALQGDGPDHTVMIFETFEAPSATMEIARSMAAGNKNFPAVMVDIGGQAFWKSETDETIQGNKLQGATYAGLLKGYVLILMCLSSDVKMTARLENAIESIAFFDPERAADVAGPGRLPYYPPDSAEAIDAIDEAFSRSKVGRLSPGTLLGNNYTNDDLRFSFSFPKSWTFLDKAALDKMNGRQQTIWGKPSSTETSPVDACNRVLVHGDGQPIPGGIEPVIQVDVTDPVCYRQFPTTSDPAAIEDLISNEQRMVGSLRLTPMTSKGQPAVRESEIQGRRVISVSEQYDVTLPGGVRSAIVISMDLIEATSELWLERIVIASTNGTLKDLQRNQPIFRNP